jgi:membrane-associated protein
MHALGPGWLNAPTLLDQLGSFALWGSAAVIFIECGLFIFFMPGDSLLFTVGLFIGQGAIHMNLAVACVVLSAAAFLGNVVGYEIGRAVGAPLYEREGRLLKREYFDKTNEFFDKYGNKAIVLARFVPVVRTFITVVAGVGRMDRRRFFTYSLIGAVGWATSVTVAGYFLGKITFIRTHIDVILVLIVLVSVIPMVVEYLRHQRRSQAIAGELGEAADDLTDRH